MKLKKRLLALFLALFLAFSPLLFAVPAQASVLDGPSPAPVVDGFRCAFSFQDSGGIVFAYIPNSRFHSDLPSLYFFDWENFMFFVVSGLSLSVDYPYVSASVLGRSVWVSSSYTFYEENSLLVFSSFEEASSISSVSWPLDFSSFSGFIAFSSSVVVVNSFPDDRFLLLPLYGEPGPGVLSVFSGVGSWLGGAVNNMISMFYAAESGLTALGVLAVASLALAVVLLLLYLIAGWLKFR